MIIWHIASIFEFYETTFFPAPSSVLHQFLEDLKTGLFVEDLIASLKRVSVGFIAAVAIGLPLGLLTFFSKIANNTVGVLISITRPIPPIAYVPFVVYFMGLGESSKYFLVFIGAVVPIWTTTHYSLSQTNKKYIWYGETIGMNFLEKLRYVYLPANKNALLNGLRIALGISFYCLIAAEIAGATHGIAYRIDVSNQVYNVERMIIGIVSLGFCNYVAQLLLFDISFFRRVS